MAQRLAREGAEPAPTMPDEFAKFMRAEYEQCKKTIARAKIKID